MNRTNSDPELYELVALRLNDDPNGEQVHSLASWILDPSVNGLSRSKSMQVDLIEPVVRTSKPYQVGGERDFLLVGQAIQPDAVYALAIRLFSKVNIHLCIHLCVPVIYSVMNTGFRHPDCN